MKKLLIVFGLILAVFMPFIANSATAWRAQDRAVGVRTSPEQRLALVLGNAAYKEAPLANPVNDARDVAAALRGCGFEVLSGEDRTQRQMKELIRQFGQKLRQGGVGIFYFAGHGVQVGGRNYLIPVGAEINAEAEVEYEAVEVGFVLAQMEEARNRLNVVILDACRNNPYARSFRSDARGLAGVRNAPSGTLIAYATAANDVASDGGGGRNGLFTGELLAQLKTPGLTLEQVFRRTRTIVRSKSSGRQVPYEYSSVEGEDFYFIPPKAQPFSEEQGAWERAKQRRTPEAVRAFLSLYAGGQFESEARGLLAELEKNAKPVSTPTPKATGLTPMIALPRGVDPARLAVHSFTTATVDDKGNVRRIAGTPTQQYTEDLGNGVLLEMVAVKGSGSIQDFWIGKYEVTQVQWQAVMGNNPSHFKGDKLPVEQVSWDEAQEFCRKLNQRLGLSSAEGYRLPQEVEWELAARAGTQTEFAFGDTISPEIVNYDGNYPYGNAAKGIYRKKTVEVGSLGVANGWGLYDMHGNVWEWCGELYTSGGSSRVIRGGGWYGLANFCTSAFRSSGALFGIREYSRGFRLVRK